MIRALEVYNKNLRLCTDAQNYYYCQKVFGFLQSLAPSYDAQLIVAGIDKTLLRGSRINRNLYLKTGEFFYAANLGVDSFIGIDGLNKSEITPLGRPDIITKLYNLKVAKLNSLRSFLESQANPKPQCIVS